MSNCIIWKGKTWSQGRYGYLYVDGKTISAHTPICVSPN
jgi:hypothetical protein